MLERFGEGAKLETTLLRLLFREEARSECGSKGKGRGGSAEELAAARRGRGSHPPTVSVLAGIGKT
jgi:hypothetical protein